MQAYYEKPSPPMYLFAREEVCLLNGLFRPNWFKYLFQDSFLFQMHLVLLSRYMFH